MLCPDNECHEPEDKVAELKKAARALINVLSDDDSDYPDMSMYRTIQSHKDDLMEAVEAIEETES